MKDFIGMKGRNILWVVMVCLVTATSFAERYTVEVGQFEKLKINGNVRVIYKNLSDSTGYARYDAPAGSEDIFTFTNKNEGNLKVEPSDEKWGQSDLPVIYLYSDFLTSLESYSEQQVEVRSISPCASFNVTQVGNGSISVENLKTNNVTAAITTGNGSIYLTGSCVNANFRMVGAGLISADQLSAENVKCRILGTGSIGCWPIDNLKVTGLGSTKIYYKGHPHIKKTGGGKLFELPDEMDEDAYERLGTPVPSLSQPTTVVDDEEDDDAEDDDAEDEEEEDDNYQTVVTEDD
ncbi:MAG: DUF2807 domain-containing protein [Muribaculaceae bacterium]|nr:DUF2807 domain-containing protein [Muribaculaceae bacterium]